MENEWECVWERGRELGRTDWSSEGRDRRYRLRKCAAAVESETYIRALKPDTEREVTSLQPCPEAWHKLKSHRRELSLSPQRDCRGPWVFERKGGSLESKVQNVYLPWRLSRAWRELLLHCFIKPAHPKQTRKVEPQGHSAISHFGRQEVFHRNCPVWGPRRTVKAWECNNLDV